MAILGKGYPVIDSFDGTDPFNNFEILYALVKPDYEDKKEIENTSVINGNKMFTKLWTHMTFKITVHLHLYPDPKAAFDNLIKLLDHDVYFKPHYYKEDGVTESNYIQKTADPPGNAIFHCTRCEPNDKLNDLLFIELKSTTPCRIDDTIF